MNLQFKSRISVLAPSEMNVKTIMTAIVMVMSIGLSHACTKDRWVYYMSMARN